MWERHSNFLSVNEERGAWTHGEIEAGDSGRVRGRVPCSAGEDRSPLCGKLLAEGCIEEFCISVKWYWLTLLSLSLAL